MILKGLHEEMCLILLQRYTCISCRFSIQAQRSLKSFCHPVIMSHCWPVPKAKIKSCVRNVTTLKRTHTINENFWGSNRFFYIKIAPDKAETAGLWRSIFPLRRLLINNLQMGMQIRTEHGKKMLISCSLLKRNPILKVSRPSRLMYHLICTAVLPNMLYKAPVLEECKRLKASIYVQL